MGLNSVRTNRHPRTFNGKVERSQKTDKAEFYATVDLTASNLDDLLAEWQHYYN